MTTSVVRAAPRTKQWSFIAWTALLGMIFVFFAAVSTFGGLEAWYTGAARAFTPPDCSEADACRVHRNDYINCGSLFDQSTLAVDPNCKQAFSMVRGWITVGYAIAGLAALGAIVMAVRRARASRHRREELIDAPAGRRSASTSDNGT